MIFVAVLLSLAALVWLATRNKVGTFRVEPDYRFRLGYEGLHLAFDPDDAKALQIGVNLRNASAHPIRYVVDDMRVVIGGHTVPWQPLHTQGGIIPPMIGRTYRFPLMNVEQIKKEAGNTCRGEVRFNMSYGPPDGQSVRELKMTISIDARLDGKPSIVDTIINESDQDV
jgi:hypothetical protein